MQEFQHMELKRQWKDDLLKWTAPFAQSGGAVNGGIKRRFSYIESDPDLRAKAARQATSTPLRTAERWLQELRDQVLVELKGAPKTSGPFAIKV